MVARVIDGVKFKLAREQLGISVMELGRRLGWKGNPNYLYRLQRNKHEASFGLLREIAAALNVEPWRIMRDEVLEAAITTRPGAVAEAPGFYRTDMFTIPIVGYVSAGEPSVPNYSDGDTPPGVGVLGEIDLAQDFGPGAACYAVKIRGDSMLPRFRDGGIVVCSPEASWKHGDTCLIRHLDGRVWVKRLVDHEGTWCLEPDNPLYESIPLRRDEIAYVHRVTAALLR